MDRAARRRAASRAPRASRTPAPSPARQNRAERPSTRRRRTEIARACAKAVITVRAPEAGMSERNAPPCAEDAPDPKLEVTRRRFLAGIAIGTAVVAIGPIPVAH